MIQCYNKPIFSNVSLKSDHVYIYLTIFIIPQTLSFWNFTNCGFVLKKLFRLMVAFTFLFFCQKKKVANIDCVFVFPGDIVYIRINVGFSKKPVWKIGRGQTISGKCEVNFSFCYPKWLLSLSCERLKHGLTSLSFVYSLFEFSNPEIKSWSSSISLQSSISLGTSPVWMKKWVGWWATRKQGISTLLSAWFC